MKTMSIEEIVDLQLEAYNRANFETFAACYRRDIVSYCLMSALPNLNMCGDAFFSHYRKKFSENPNLHCKVTKRLVHDNLVIDQELISDYRNQNHTEVVIYKVEEGLISAMWFSREIPL